MLPFRLVLDTNTIISAALKQHSLPYKILSFACTKPAKFYITNQIFAEYKRVLAYRKFRFPEVEQKMLLDLISQHSKLVEPTFKLDICSDPDDNIFLECADAARADFLITGNCKHFPDYWKTTKIVSPKKLIEIIAPHLTE